MALTDLAPENNWKLNYLDLEIEALLDTQSDEIMKKSIAKKPIKKRIEDALVESGGVLGYHDLLWKVFPRDEYLKSYQNSSNGGPPGCAMAFGKALREMVNDGLINYSFYRSVRTIKLRR